MTRILTLASLVAASVLVSGCSTVMNNSNQPVNVVVRGSKNADCNLYTSNYRNQVPAPAKVVLERSHEDLTVECYGDDNRYTKFTVSPVMTKETALNVSNGVVPGVAYDTLSGGMWAYPDPIIVDFRTTDDVPVPAPQWPPVTVEPVAPEETAAAPVIRNQWRMQPIVSPQDFYDVKKSEAKPVKSKKKRPAGTPPRGAAPEKVAEPAVKPSEEETATPATPEETPATPETAPETAPVTQDEPPAEAPAAQTPPAPAATEKAAPEPAPAAPVTDTTVPPETQKALGIAPAQTETSVPTPEPVKPSTETEDEKTGADDKTPAVDPTAPNTTAPSTNTAPAYDPSDTSKPSK